MLCIYDVFRNLEKEGYETTYSDWLPVPPQLEVNIAMQQKVQPNVVSVRAYEDAIEVKFDKYMMPELLTTENIVVMADSNIITGTIELLDEEVCYEGKTEMYASKLRFNATEPFPAKEVTLLVKNRVKSYAGICMQEDYSQTFEVELEVQKIVCDTSVTVVYGEQSTVAVAVLPAAAAAGKVLRVQSLAPLILGVDTTSVMIDENGMAEVTLTGELPGTAALLFEIDGYDVATSMIVNVEKREDVTVATPVASIASGSTVEKGTEIYLSCATENAVIYYTLDGSCPCDDSESVHRYDGTPIVVNETVTIKAIAYAENMYESEVAAFIYTVSGETDINNVVTDKFSVYPNLVKNILNINIPDGEYADVCIVNIAGRVVFEKQNMKGYNSVNFTGLDKGMYIVSIKNSKNRNVIKVIKLDE